MSEVVRASRVEPWVPPSPGGTALDVVRGVADRVRKGAKLVEQRLAVMQPVEEIAVRASSAARISAGCAAMAAAGIVQGGILLALLPRRLERIRACNYFGKVMGRLFMRLSGAPLTMDGMEHLNRDRPAIYISNHSSILDIFLAIWLSPVGTVGVAKREVALYPVFGQLYLLSGHLLIDRGRSERAVASIRKLGEYVRQHRLSIFLWPEGTRSRSGRLQPFKKGVVHLAIQTGLPVVPIVVQGAQRSWRKGTYTVRPEPIHVTVLPAIATTDWSEERIDEILEELREAFSKHLPEEQRPRAPEQTFERVVAGEAEIVPA